VKRSDNFLNCVQIEPFGQFKWITVPCMRRALVICQIEVEWSGRKVRYEMAALKEHLKELGENVDAERSALRSEIETLKSQLTSSNAEIDTLKIQLNASNDRSDAEMDALKNQLNSSTEENYAEIDTLKNQLTSLKEWSSDENSALKERLDLMKIEFNPVPKNFTYVQLPFQDEPGDLWPGVRWVDVTGSYKGCFFRTLGDGSAEFGSVQVGDAPRLAWVSSKVTSRQNVSSSITIPLTGESGNVWIGDGGFINGGRWGLRFRTEGGEVRPQNMAVRIWKRV